LLQILLTAIQIGAENNAWFTLPNTLVFSLSLTNPSEWILPSRWRTFMPPSCLALARWTGWSADKVGRRVKCWRREWNEEGTQGPLVRDSGLSSDKLFVGASEFLVIRHCWWGRSA